MKYLRHGAIVLVLLLTGCAPKTYTINEPRLIVFKSPKLRYADMGYIRQNDDEVRADLFVAGQLVQSFEIATLVCVNEGCLRKSTFNADYLHPDYPDDLLLHVLLGKPIFNKAFLEKTEEGFRQSIKGERYNIAYEVSNGNITFRDKLNRLLIKISKVKG